MDQSTVQLIMNSFLLLHFLGIASLLAGFLTQMKQIKSGMSVNAGVLHGAWLMLISALVMTGLASMPNEAGEHEAINALVITIKSLVLAVIFFIALTYRKNEKTPAWVVPAIAGLTILNMAIAIFGGVFIE